MFRRSPGVCGRRIRCTVLLGHVGEHFPHINTGLFALGNTFINLTFKIRSLLFVQAARFQYGFVIIQAFYYLTGI